MIRRFSFEELPLKGAWRITPFRAEDVRGSFVKDWSEEAFAAAGIEHGLKEVFYTYSRKGVVRALHFQEVKEQPKLVRCVAGSVWDVIVDLRKESPTYRRWMGFRLDGETGDELLVPACFGHGYLVLEDSVVVYKCAERFYAEHDTGIRWDDPDLAIDWPLELVGGRERVILAEKDLNLRSFAQWEKESR